jgi:energy-converting hydrogenase Eha subunit G
MGMAVAASEQWFVLRFRRFTGDEIREYDGIVALSRLDS